MAFFSLMRSLGIGNGDEVIIPGFTCSVMPNAIIRTGAKPVYSDIDADTMGSDASAIERCITPQTKMIVAQHSFGIPCNIDEIADLAKSKGIFLVEDSALALDSRIHGKSVGTWGDAAFFSTDHSKPLNTIIGGMLYTPDKDIFEDVKRTIGNLPDLSKNHQKNIFQRFNYERKNYIPSRYPRSIIRETIRDTMGRFFGKPQVFLENDYTPSISVSSSYPYPAKMPAFLAQLGLFEIERWANEKRERKALLQDYLNCSEIARDEIQIPNAYYDKEKEIVPLRFIFRSPQAITLRKKFEDYIDVNGMWFLDPVICCPNGPQALGYRNGNCVSSEGVCSTILNMPCVLPDGWNKRAGSVFHDILSGSK
jgi:dTDP-4-amino-4,6-dideoxygalactose transaminase